MPLKTLVKAGSITNLSDARYCAGMGVDMLGYSVIEGQQNHIPSKLYQEIRGWVSGPQVVAEIYGHTDASVAQSIIDQYAPDYFEIDFNHYQRWEVKPAKPFIIRLAETELNFLDIRDPQVVYWLIDEKTMLSQIKKIIGHPVLAKISSKTRIPELLSIEGIKGIALEGSAEIRPGYKSYDHIAEILESLEE